MPKFSIIIPIYNVEPYLRTCIESVLNQSYTDFELILVDDGSPDNSPLICDEYAKKDSRIRVIHKENGGVVSARNEGCRVATGEYVCCIDGDDWIHSAYIEKFADAIDKHKPDVVCCGYFLAYEESLAEVAFSNIVGYHNRSSVENNIFPILIQNRTCIGFPPSVWAKAVKRELYVSEQLAIPLQIKMGEDGAIIVPCLYNANSVFIVQDCLYYYRQVATSMTKNKKALDWNGPVLRYNHINSRINLSDFDFREQQYRATVHALFNVVISQFYRHESYRVIVKDIKYHLQNEVYSEAIKNCNFQMWKGRFAAFSLKYRVYILMWLYSRIK